MVQVDTNALHSHHHSSYHLHVRAASGLSPPPPVLLAARLAYILKSVVFGDVGMVLAESLATTRTEIAGGSDLSYLTTVQSVRGG